MSRETLKKIANTLGYTVEQLSDVTGYTRQALYKIANLESKTNTKRAMVAVRALRHAVDREYKKDCEQLALLYADRNNACDVFEKMILQED